MHKWDFYSVLYNPVIKMAASQRRQIHTDLQQILPSDPKIKTIYIAGCGTGLDFIPLKEHDLTAVDLSAKMLAKAKNLGQKLHIKANIRQDFADNSQMPDQSCDLVVLHLICAIVDNPKALMQEASRICKSGGIISIWDKFLDDGKKPSWLRNFMNSFFKKLGTQINLKPSDLIDDNFEIIQRKKMFGMMQHIVLRKK